MDINSSPILNNLIRKPNNDESINEQLKAQLEKLEREMEILKREHFEVIKSGKHLTNRQQTDNHVIRQKLDFMPADLNSLYDNGLPKYFVLNMPERRKVCPFQMENASNANHGKEVHSGKT